MALVYVHRACPGGRMKVDKEYFLSQAGFSVRVVFKPTEFGYAQKVLISSFQKAWAGFLSRRSKKVDFTVVVSSDAGDKEILVRGGRRYYYLTYTRDFAHGKIDTYYTVNLRGLDLLFREIFAFLIRKDGFLLHASSVVDRKGALSVFMARSGGGKTTTASLYKGGGYYKFGDDIILVRKMSGRWKFFSPPFIEKNEIPRKNQASRAKFYVVKKSLKPNLALIKEKKVLLPFLLGQIWLNRGTLEKPVLKTALLFLMENNFSELGVVLNGRKMRKIIK